MKLPISVTILTKNSQKYLDEVLSNLQLFDEVVIFIQRAGEVTAAKHRKRRLANRIAISSHRTP